MWCVAKLDQEYIERMEDVLDTLAAPAKLQEPVLALDERPVQLHGSARPGRPMRPGKPAREDYEYVRCGTANVFCIVDPKRGHHLTHATPNRTAMYFARAMRQIARSYPKTKKIHLIMDNLSTHSERSLITAFGPKQGRKLWRRFKVHYTPKHGSWLNPAEIEASLWSRECLGKDRVGTLPVLAVRTSAWNTQATRLRRPIRWTFTSAKAREVFRYERSTTPGAQH